jgi:Asp-tRNA(Asn)/Glu-tRNA(Gln) amidotransferase A subunit family amidase
VSELCFTPATELARQIAARELSPVELVDAVLARIEATAPQLNAFCLLRADEARREAVEAEKAVADGKPLGPLHGIPISIKDLTSTKGIRTTFGSHAYADNVPDVDAVFVTRLREAGAILLGKTNTPEFGNKGVTDSPLHGTTANPWALDHTAGGSSGGAAAAVAAGLGPLAEGSDGAGSIRIPASCCGVVGYKPSFGRVPMYPRNGYHTISHHGPLTRTVADAALMLSVMAGPDARDPHVRTDPPADYLEAVREPDIAGWTVGFSSDLGHLPVEPAIREAVTKATATFDDLGANLDDDVPALPDARDPMAVIWRVVFEAIVREQIRPAVAPDQMDPHLRELAAAGERIDAAAYYEAVSLFRIALYHELEALFRRYRLLVTPTLAVAPFPHPGEGRPGPDRVAGEQVNPFLGWLLTYHFNLTGQPAVSVPCGFSADGLPIGLQIVGRPGADEDVLRAAAAFQAATGFERHRPPLSAT